MELTLFYATNREHLGKDRWNPKGYGTKFSPDGIENLRFGRLALNADAAKVASCLTEVANGGTGDGEKLAAHLADCATTATVRAYLEKIPDAKVAERDQAKVVLGSEAMFTDVKQAMECCTDVVVYIHGFNVSWKNAVGSALALQVMLNAAPGRDLSQQATVVLFTWPSDGMALPFVSYKSDRTEAKGSGYAFGRGMLKLRDFLMKLKKDGPLCGQDIHLLCHSMGNYLLQSALQRLADFSPGTVMPRIFEQIFLCAPDVDDDILESGKPMARLPEIARGITIYHNRGDKAMYVSDYTKGNPERLGTNGAAHPTLLHNKVHQVDCTPVVTAGYVEHSYYLDGAINGDIRLGIDGAAPDDPRRRRKLVTNLANVWQMTP
jgi:hypothetical protein